VAKAVGNHLHHQTYTSGIQLRNLAFYRSAGGSDFDRAANLDEHARTASRKVRAKRIYNYKDGSPDRTNRARHRSRMECDRSKWQFWRPVDDSREASGCRSWRSHRNDGVWALCWNLRFTNQLTLLGGRVEQHYFHSRRGKESEAKHSSVAGI